MTQHAPPERPFCNVNQSRFVCAECLTPMDCVDSSAGRLCDTSIGTCAETTSNLPADDAAAPNGSDGAMESALEASSHGDAIDGRE
jgi:hypothetical protein